MPRLVGHADVQSLKPEAASSERARRVFQTGKLAQHVRITHNPGRPPHKPAAQILMWP